MTRLTEMNGYSATVYHRKPIAVGADLRDEDGEEGDDVFRGLDQTEDVARRHAACTNSDSSPVCVTVSTVGAAAAVVARVAQNHRITGSTDS